MRRRHAVIPTIAVIAGAASAAAAPAASCTSANTPDCTPLAASLNIDEGNYRKVPKGSRAGMSRAANSAGTFAVRKHFAWYIGTIDAKFGVVCGKRGAYDAGVTVVKKNGRWTAPKNPSSGMLQSADYDCQKADD